MPNEEFVESTKLSAEDVAHEESNTMKPALVINIFSWSTPLIGVVMLIVGLLVGYLGRPYSPMGSETLLSTSVEPSTQSSSIDLPEQSSNQADNPETQQLMDFLVSETRHLMGDPSAQITLIEFSDFK